MKELEEKFKIISESYPNVSSYICFIRTIKRLNPPGDIIARGFSKLVDKEDYSRGIKQNLVKHIQALARLKK